MALVLSSDPSDGDWIVASDVPWEQLVTFGPPGFPAYARLRFLPDPRYAGQRENDAERDSAPRNTDQWRALFELLAANTRTPEDCCFCLWEGWPFAHRAHRPTLNVPRDARAPARRYFLFHGSLSDAGDWAPISSREGRRRTNPLLSGQRTTRGASPTMSTRIGPGSGRTRLSSNDSSPTHVSMRSAPILPPSSRPTDDDCRRH